MAETKRNERAADGGEIGVLSEGGHVPSLSACAKTAFSLGAKGNIPSGYIVS